MIRVHAHAVDRFIERVEGMSRAAARAEILSHGRAIAAAAAFDCRIVKLGNGARLVLDGENVVTVYGARMLLRQSRKCYPQGAPA